MDHLTVEWQRLNLTRLGMALMITSLVENVIYHPWWVLKTREQFEVRNAGGVWRNSLHFAQTIWRKEGIRALYRGFWAGSIGSFPSVYLYLITYHKVKHELSTNNNSQTLQLSAPFLAGVSAEMVALYFFVPIDVITQRMQLCNSAGKNSFTIAKDIISQEGLKGMYRGTLLTLLKLGIGSGVWWLTYEESKYAMSKTGQPPSTFMGIIAGFMAGILSTIVTNPLDVVKTRIQVQASDTSGIPYSKAIKGFQEIWHKEGWIGINRGIVPKLISQGPLSAFWAVIYELALKYSFSHSALTD